jgi:phosphonate transport system substrate-binding protein
MITPILFPAVPSPRWRASPGLGLAVLVWLMVPALQVADGGQTNEAPVVHFAFSRTMFKDINENDAKAAMRVYCKTIGDAYGIDTSSGPIYLDGTNAIAEMLRLKQIDMISLTTEEYLVLEAQGLSGPFMLSSINQTVTEEYVLLVRDDGPIRNLADLKGHSLIILNDLRGSLTALWLEVFCREHNLGPASQVFSKVTASTKVTQVVLPVFFGKADACVTTRNGWDVMGELNPQVKKQLRAIAVSPPVVPGLSCFRRDFPEALKQKMVQTAEESHSQPAFKQLMALFKTDELSLQSESVLDSTRQLITAYYQLRAGTNQIPASGSEPGLAQKATETKEKRMTADRQAAQSPNASPP